jgi:hypothetical protein
MRLNRIAITLAAFSALGLATACSEDTRQQAEEAAASGAADVKEAAGEIHGNVEDAVKTLEDTYDEDRKKGKGRIEAAGNAYDAVEDKAH